VFIEAKDDGGSGDNWTTGAISHTKLQSNRHHQQTNIQFFTGWMPFLSPTQQCQSTLPVSMLRCMTVLQYVNVTYPTCVVFDSDFVGGW